MTTTVVTANGVRSVHADTVPAKRRFDCFYLYPTNSIESTVNSDLTIQPSETSNAMDQASRFSKQCNVWAPMYKSDHRQRTGPGQQHRSWGLHRRL